MSARRCKPGGGHPGHLGLVEDRVVLVALPLLGPLAGVAQLLGVEVGVLLVDRLQVDAQVDQDLLGDDRGQEPVEGLLGAAVGIVGEIGQGVHQGAGQGGRVPHLEPRLLRLALGGDAEDDLGLVLIGPDRAGEGFDLEHPVDIGRESHLRRVRLLVGDRLHADDGLALVRDLHPPVDPVLRAGVDFHGPRGVVHRLEHAALELEHDLDRLLGLELVVDVGREHDLILLDEEARGLKPDEQILGGDDLGLALADAGSRAHGPGLDLPGGQALGQRKIDLGGAVGGRGEGRGPESGVGEVGPDDGLNSGPRTGSPSRRRRR